MTPRRTGQRVGRVVGCSSARGRNSFGCRWSEYPPMVNADQRHTITLFAVDTFSLFAVAPGGVLAVGPTLPWRG